MRGWDELCRTRRVVAIGGLDAHQYGKRIGPFVPVRVMAYHRSFQLIRTHVLCERPPARELERDRELVYDALREGRCYIAVDAVAPARGFRFEAADVPMGGEAPAGRRTLHVRTPLPARLRLIRDGTEIAAADGTTLDAEVEEPGVYRVEARAHVDGAASAPGSSPTRSTCDEEGPPDFGGAGRALASRRPLGRERQGASGSASRACSANPCEPSLTTTVFSPAGKRLGVQHVQPAKVRRADCFYVYPTVSDQPRPQATKVVDDVLRSIVLQQTARYSRDCRVFAPVYRQVTIQGLFNESSVTPAMRRQGYADVREAWRTYLRKYNHGRGVVLVSHSQGSFVLRKLIAEEVDGNPAVRKRMLSAILLGGNVTVKKGSDRGGDFKHVRACRSRNQLSCVIAFSAFNETPPANCIFGRTTTRGPRSCAPTRRRWAVGPGGCRRYTPPSRSRRA